MTEAEVMIERKLTSEKQLRVRLFYERFKDLISRGMQFTFDGVELSCITGSGSYSDGRHGHDRCATMECALIVDGEFQVVDNGSTVIGYVHVSALPKMLALLQCDNIPRGDRVLGIKAILQGEDAFPELFPPYMKAPR